MAQTDWHKSLAGPATAGEKPRALLAGLGDLLVALNPQELNSDTSSAAATHDGSVLTTLRHRTEDLLQIEISCAADGFASISSPALGSPEEISDSWHQTVEEWCADALSSITDALLQRYTLTEYRRNGQLRRTRLTSDNPETAGSTIVADRWTELLPLRRGNLDETTRHASYSCHGNLPSSLLRSAVFVVEPDGIVSVFPHMRYANAALEAGDPSAQTGRLAYDERGASYRAELYRGTWRFVFVGKADLQALTAALRSWSEGPIRLADDPHAYAVYQLTGR